MAFVKPPEGNDSIQILICIIAIIFTSKNIYITTLHNVHSHNLDSNITNITNIIQFGDNVQISPEIIKEIEFLTDKCKMSTAMKRQYLEAKFPVYKVQGITILNVSLNFDVQMFEKGQAYTNVASEKILKSAR
ncbi:hypothetical protein Glove_41g117 [Diversispora epigaea]|uniref:Uncharacterized protein n=1 Tax=Diversispora epigaea TaxID=1348612 RepID=A0A397JQ13_9GLOM|nr:hypothetical protein Glove_41g117 [Diversispora epigaea]